MSAAIALKWCTAPLRAQAERTAASARRCELLVAGGFGGGAVCAQAASVSGSGQSLRAAAAGLRLAPASSARPGESGAPMAASRAPSMSRPAAAASLSSIAPPSAASLVRVQLPPSAKLSC